MCSEQTDVPVTKTNTALDVAGSKTRKLTHLCPPQDIFHSFGPRLCPLCSSIPPGCGGSAAGNCSSCRWMLSGSTDPEVDTLTQEKSVVAIYPDSTLHVWNDCFMSRALWLCNKKPERVFIHQHIDFSPRQNQICRNTWNCPVCSNSLRSDRRPAWSTRWYLQGQQVRWKKR